MQTVLGWRLGKAIVATWGLLLGLAGVAFAGGQNIVVGVNSAYYLELDSLTGEAFPVTGVGFGAFERVEGLAYDVNTNTLYGSDIVTDQLIGIDPSTGIGTVVGPVGFQNIAALAFDPNTDTLYGMRALSNELITIDTATGAGTVIGTFGIGFIVGLAFDPITNTLYGAELITDQLIAFDPATGVESVIGSLGGAEIAGLAFDPKLNVLYGLDNETELLVAIDPATAAITEIGPAGYGEKQCLAFDPDSRTLYGMIRSTFQLVTMDVATGANTPVYALRFDNVRGLAFDSKTNTLYGTTIDLFGTGQLITIAPGTGVGTAVGDLGFRVVEGLAFDPHTDTLYGADILTDQLITIDPLTGAGEAVGPIGINSVRGLAFDANTETLYGTDSFRNQLVTIDVATGAGTVVGQLGFGFVDGLTFDHRTDTLYGTDLVTDQLITIDPVTGAGSVVGSTVFRDIEGLCVILDEIDLGDFALLFDCVTGPGVPSTSDECDRVDFDGDGDIDLVDFGILQAVFTGPIYGQAPLANSQTSPAHRLPDEVNDVRRSTMTAVVVSTGLHAGAAGAEGIWNWTHQASGAGTANVFDGGPPVFDEGQTGDPTHPNMSFDAYDPTGSGSMAASASANGRSTIITTPDDSFRFRVEFTARYFPSSFPGGDNPGGEAEGEILSVIEFLMPADEIGLSYRLLIHETYQFTGSTAVVVENVTQGQFLLGLAAEVPQDWATFVGHTGDVIRITSMMSGHGNMGPGSLRDYDSALAMWFSVPEPGRSPFPLGEVAR